MAIYHLKVSIGNRAGDQSAAAKFDFISRRGRYAKADHEEVEYMESGNMPSWAEDDPRAYWQAADEHERANGRLFVQLIFALPQELNSEERRELSMRFAGLLAGEEKLPYTFAVFKGETKNPEKRNPYVYLVISERINDGIERPPEQWFIRANKTAPERGGALKSRAINRRRWIYHTRQEWALEANRALQRAGREERIDHRSLAERFMEAMQEYEAAENDPTQSEAERERLLERAAELSREPEVHRGPQKRRKWRVNQR